MIVTSYLFPDGRFSLERLRDLGEKVGKEKLVVDISCRKRDGGWVVAMNGWKTLTDTWVNQGTSPPTSPTLHSTSSPMSTSISHLSQFHSIQLSSSLFPCSSCTQLPRGNLRIMWRNGSDGYREYTTDRGSLLRTTHPRCRRRRIMSRDRSRISRVSGRMGNFTMYLRRRSTRSVGPFPSLHFSISNTGPNCYSASAAAQVKFPDGILTGRRYLGFGIGR